MKKIGIFLILLVVACFPILVGIFHPGFFVTDDGNWMVIRLSAFYEALRQGQFPVRFLPRLNNEYGYPVADFLYPLFLYAGSLIHIFHINFVTTVKLLFSLAIVLSAMGSFLWLRRKFGDFAGFIGATVFALFPYHVWDVTKRGSLGEALAMAIVPFIFLGIDSENILLTALGIGLLITAHNTLALLFLPIIALYVLLERKIKQQSLSFLLGLGLSAFFWVPALYDQQYTIFGETVVSRVDSYFLSSEVYPLIGVIAFFVILLGIVQAFKKSDNQLIYFLVVSLFSISLTSSISQPIWKLFHLGTYVQFPFRMLSLTAVGVGFVSSFIIAHWQKKYSLVLGIIILILLYVSSWQFFVAKQYSNEPDTFYSTNQDSTTVQNEYMPKTVKKLYTSKLHMEYSGNAIYRSISLQDKGSWLSLKLDVSQPSRITLGKIYFPGWTVTIDNRPANISTNDYGFIVVPVSKGIHTIQAKFQETTTRLLADVISLVTIISMAVLLLFQKKEKYGKSN